MKMGTWVTLLMVSLLFLFGCSGGSSRQSKAGNPDMKTASKPAGQQDEEAEVQASLATLDPNDRQLAEGQKFCAVRTDSRLGSMGTPVKILVREQPVFLCCKGCQKKALADPDKTLAKIRELKEKTAGRP